MQCRLGLYLSDLTPLFDAAAAADSTLTLTTPQGAIAVDRLGDVLAHGATHGRRHNGVAFEAVPTQARLAAGRQGSG